MPTARASAGALPLTAPPHWSTDLRGTTGGQQVTTHYWAESHINRSLRTNNQTKAMGSEFRFPPPWLPLHTMCTSRLQWSKLQFEGVPRGGPKVYIKSHQLKTIWSFPWHTYTGFDRPKNFWNMLGRWAFRLNFANRTKSMCSSPQ